MKKRAEILIVVLLIMAGAVTTDAAFEPGPDDYPVTGFGAVGDGVTLNTEAIQQAIDRCAAEGGGRVVIPPGTYLSGTLVMKSRVELHVDRGATLLGSTDISDYPEMEVEYRFYGEEWVQQSLIFGEGLEEVALTGQGTIDGQGGSFQAETRKKPDRYRNRPYLIRFTECQGVTVRDLSLRNSAMWMQHYLACDNVRILNLDVYNHCNKNNDMIDIDGCRDVIISGCRGDTDDDALTLKSTGPRACENVVISDCIISSHCNAIKCGTESTGGFKNITITNCIIKPSAEKEVIYGYPQGICGIALEIVDGGTMDGVSISNVLIQGPEVPLFIRLGNRARQHTPEAPVPAPGALRNITVSQLVVKDAGRTGCSITGIPGHRVEDISIENLQMELEGGATGYRLPGEVPELEELYPESTMFGVLPASLFYVRHAKGIDLHRIRAEFKGKDPRDHVVAEDVEGFRYSGIGVKGIPAPRVTIIDNTENDEK